MLYIQHCRSPVKRIFSFFFFTGSGRAENRVLDAEKAVSDGRRDRDLTTPGSNFDLVDRRLFPLSKRDTIDARAIRNDDGERDFKKPVVHLLDTGGFALKEEGQVIAYHIRRFLSANVKRGSQGRG